MNTTKQTTAEMCEVINSAKPGEKLKVVFLDKADEDMKGDLLFIFCMCLPDREGLSLHEGALPTLKAVADSGSWKGCNDYTFTVLQNFDARQFIRHTVSMGRVESISKAE